MKNIDNMTPQQYRRVLEQLQLSQKDAARLLGVDERTSRRWAALNQETYMPPIAARFLRYLVATKKSGDYALRKLEAA